MVYTLKPKFMLGQRSTTLSSNIFTVVGGHNLFANLTAVKFEGDGVPTGFTYQTPYWITATSLLQGSPTIPGTFRISATAGGANLVVAIGTATYLRTTQVSAWGLFGDDRDSVRFHLGYVLDGIPDSDFSLLEDRLDLIPSQKLKAYILRLLAFCETAFDERPLTAPVPKASSVQIITGDINRTIEQLTIDQKTFRRQAYIEATNDLADALAVPNYNDPTRTAKRLYHNSAARVLRTLYVNSITGALDDLTDVTITTPTAGQVLVWNGSAWVNGSAGTGTTTGGTPTTNVVQLVNSSISMESFQGAETTSTARLVNPTPVAVTVSSVFVTGDSVFTVAAISPGTVVNANSTLSIVLTFDPPNSGAIVYTPTATLNVLMSDGTLLQSSLTGSVINTVDASSTSTQTIVSSSTTTYTFSFLGEILPVSLTNSGSVPALVTLPTYVGFIVSPSSMNIPAGTSQSFFITNLAAPGAVGSINVTGNFPPISPITVTA
jgi:hypothetical protein